MTLSARTLASTPLLPKEFEDKLYQDVRRITGLITGDPENLDKLISQLRQTSPNFKSSEIRPDISTSQPVGKLPSLCSVRGLKLTLIYFQNIMVTRKLSPD